MEIEPREASTVIGLVVTILGLGKLYGNKNAILKNVVEDIEELKERHSNDIARLEKAYKADVALIVRKLVNDNGEPILMSYNAHDISQDKCQKLMNERYQRIDKRLDGHDIKLDKILEVVSRVDERSDNVKSNTKS